MRGVRALPLGELAPHVATLLGQLGPAARLRLIAQIRDEAITLVLPLVSRLVEAERLDLRDEAALWKREQPDYAAGRLRLAVALKMPDLTDSAAVAALSAGYGHAQASTWPHAVDAWQKATPVERAAINLLHYCTDILDRRQLDDHSRVLLLRCLDALHPNRTVGASLRARAAKGGSTPRETAAKVDRQIRRIALGKLATGAERRELAGIIAPLVKRSPKHVRDRLDALGIKPKKKRTRT